MPVRSEAISPEKLLVSPGRIVILNALLVVSLSPNPSFGTQHHIMMLKRWLREGPSSGNGSPDRHGLARDVCRTGTAPSLAQPDAPRSSHQSASQGSRRS